MYSATRSWSRSRAVTGDLLGVSQNAVALCVSLDVEDVHVALSAAKALERFLSRWPELGLRGSA